MNGRLALLMSMCALGLACGDDGSGGGGSSGGSTTAGSTSTNAMVTSASSSSGPGESTSSGSGETSDSGDGSSTSSTGTTGGPIEPADIYESIAGGIFTPFPGYVVQGRAHLVRTVDEETVVQLHIEGLDPETEYPTYVYRFPCDVQNGGMRYQIEPDGPADDVNELWPTFTTDEEGVGQASLTVDHRVRGDAQSVVVHDPNSNSRLACATLSFDPVDVAEYDGTFAPFAAADEIDEEISGTAHMEVRASGTTVEVEVEGLLPDETYMSHVHEYPCEVADAGAHYQREPGGPVDADNELWPTVTPDAMGTASDSFEVEHVARGDAQSIVIHRMTPEGSPRVACAPLVRAEYPAAHTTRGDATLLPESMKAFEGLEVAVTVERNRAGFTQASLVASGAPQGDYPVHLHHRTCVTNDGGGHYKIDPEIEETVEDNEIWLNFTAERDGNAAVEIEVEHTARPEALSAVVHDPEDSRIRIACTDLVNLSSAD